MHDYDFTVDDCLTREVERTGYQGEALGPVEPIAGVGLLLARVDVELDPIAVILDFVKPLVSRGSLGLQGCQLGSNEARHFMLYHLETQYRLDGNASSVLSVSRYGYGE